MCTIDVSAPGQGSGAPGTRPVSGGKMGKKYGAPSITHTRGANGGPQGAWGPPVTGLPARPGPALDLRSRLLVYWWVGGGPGDRHPAARTARRPEPVTGTRREQEQSGRAGGFGSPPAARSETLASGPLRPPPVPVRSPVSRSPGSGPWSSWCRPCGSTAVSVLGVCSWVRLVELERLGVWWWGVGDCGRVIHSVDCGRPCGVVVCALHLCGPGGCCTTTHLQGSCCRERQGAPRPGGSPAASGPPG